jgi:subtilisin-like proprotein convertase family protein
MNTLPRILKLLVACLVLVGATSPMHATLFTSGTLNQAVPDGNPTGLQSSLNVSGVSGNITSLDVHLNISGGYNGDLYVFLSYNNQSAVLLNRVGRSLTSPFGYADAGFSIILRDGTATDVHNYGGVGGGTLTGVWQPDGRTASPLLVLDSSPRNAMLSGFNGMDANGTWTLFVSDMAGGPLGVQSTLVSWSLDVNPVPEPTHVALGIFGVIFGLGAAGRHWLRRRATSRV